MGSIWTLWDICRLPRVAISGPKRALLNPSCTWLKLLQTNFMSLHYACATDSQNKHIYDRDNWKSNGKGSKIAQMKLLLRPIRVDSVRVLKALGPFCLWQCLFSFLQLFVFVRIHFNFKISTKLQLRNFDWTSALFSSRLQLQNLDLTSASKHYQRWKICQNFSNLFGLASKHFCECQGKAMIDLWSV